MTNYEVVIVARGSTMKRYIRAADIEEAKQMIQARFPHDPVTFITFLPGVQMPYPNRDRLDGLGVS